jgi:Putative auto-transporter adhesin, head GIN domain
MNTRLILIALAVLVCAPIKAAERSFLVGSFEEVIVQGDINVTLETGKAPTATATGERDQLAMLKVDRQGQIVRISLQGNAVRKRSDGPITVALTGRNVRKLIVLGNGKISASAVEMPQVRAEIRGSGEIDIARLKSDRFVALLVGNGKLGVGAGTTRIGEIVTNGSPVIAAPAMEMDNLRLSQNGPATTHFLVKTSAEITNSGTGSITIDGNGQCLVKKAGGANIICASKASQ